MKKFRQITSLTLAVIIASLMGAGCSKGKGGSGSYTDAGGNSGGGFVPPTNNDNTSTISAVFRKELDNHWGKNELYPMVEKGILKGINNETLGLDLIIDRAQFTALLCRTIGISEKEFSGTFSDIKNTDWFGGYVQAAFDEGFINGVSEDAFAPNENLTREQMAKILVLAYEKKVQTDDAYEEVAYNDDEKLSSWSKEYVQKARSYNLMMGDTENNFRAHDVSTRAEATVALYRIKKLLDN